MCREKTISDRFAFIFDSGKLDSSFYGDVVFEAMLKGLEITKNKTEMIVYLGDILINKIVIDIEPYIINDECCTIDFDLLNKNGGFKDYPYCWVIENIDYKIASLIDSRLKTELKGYIGLSKIDNSNTDKRKQFWRRLLKKFNIYKKKITCFQDPDITDVFCYLELANKLGFAVKYDKYAEYEEKFYEYTNYNNNKNSKELEKVDRDLMELNFMLCRELQIAGSLFW